MKVFAISDPHLSFAHPKPMNIFGSKWDNYWEKIVEDWQSKVTDEDIVLVAGDISWATDIKDAVPDLAAIDALNGSKVIIRGNHDYWWSSYAKVKAILGEHFYAVQNNALRLADNLIVCGSRGWVPYGTDEDKKIYNRELIRMRLSLEEMKKIRGEDDKVIVMTHYPPFNVDLSNNEMTDIICEYDVDAVVYGHLHGKDCRAEKLVTKGRTKYYLTSCDLVDNKLTLIMDLDLM